MNGHDLLEYLNRLTKEELSMEVRICDNKNDDDRLPKADFVMMYAKSNDDGTMETVILIES